MSTQSDRLPDRRPGWLRQKHAKQPANPRLAAWADDRLDDLYGIWDQMSIGPFRSQQAAQAAKNALYDATNKRWNRRNPDELLSLSANITDPGDGKCYARGVCRCQQNGCKPTPGPGWYIHARLYDKSEGRAHQGAKPRETWDYDPLIPRSRQAAPERAFGADRLSAAEDPPPDRSGFRRGAPKPAAASTGRSARESGSARGPQRQAPSQAEPETTLAKIRRWASG